MTQIATQSAESSLWFPPKAMLRYGIAKLIAGAMFTLLFAWLAFQWGITGTIGFTAIVFACFTPVITVTSIIADGNRMLRRQVEWTGEELVVTTPEGKTHLRVNEIGRAAWHAAADGFGLTFYDREGFVIVRLDPVFLADEADARVFLRWLRTKTQTPFEVIWKD